MGKYNWKDDYGFDETVNTVRWLSVLGDKNISLAASTRDNPAYSKGYLALTNSDVVVFSSGVHTGSAFIGDNPKTSNVRLYGQGMNNTIWEKMPDAIGGRVICSVYDMCLKKNLSLQANFHRCDIHSIRGTSYNNIYNCKLRVSFGNNHINQSSYIGVQQAISLNARSGMLFDNCELNITTQTEINYSISSYIGFNNCKFKIGSKETSYTVLSGSTSAELRASFVERCIAAGFTVPSVTEFGETLQAGRWIFSKTSAVDGLVLTGSEIHQFEIPRLISFGYTTDRNEIISITPDKTKANSFSPENADTSLLNISNTIRFKDEVDISNSLTAIAKTNIIWLGGKYQLNKLAITQSFPKEYGVFIDSTPTLSNISTTIIEAGKKYLIRSSNIDMATITYNDVSYNSALLNNNNIFIGVSGKSSFTNVSGNAKVYEVIDDTALHQTLQMRIVNKIPAEKVMAGTALTAGYWYFVEHDVDQENTADYVTYSGSNYNVGSSFLANNSGSFTKSGNVHLRRCWKDDFDINTETADDKKFWSGEQKPVWFDVRPDDLRCLMKNNNGLESEMKTDDKGNYITSGHELFYNSLLGVNGIKLPSYPIKGTYMQLRLVITTQNPM